MECLKYVVGLTNTACPCFDHGKPVDYNTTQSGLYVSDILPMNITDQAGDCEQGSVWDILDRARTLGISSFLADLAVFYSSKKTYRFAPLKGFVGDFKTSTHLLPVFTGGWMGYKIKPKRIKGGVITINGVDLNLQSLTVPVSVPVHVYSNQNLATPIATTTASIVSNGVWTSADFATPVELTLDDTDQNGYYYADDDLCYYVLYQMPLGGRYANNLINEPLGCGSCGTSQSAKKHPFSEYGTATGIEAQNVADVESSSNSSGYAYGMRLRLEAGCNATAWLCNVSYSAEATGAGQYLDVGRMIAHTLQRAIAIQALNAIILSGNINSILILEGEAIRALKNSLQKQYLENLAWIADNTPQSITDCYECKKTIFLGNLKV